VKTAKAKRIANSMCKAILFWHIGRTGRWTADWSGYLQSMINDENLPPDIRKAAAEKKKYLEDLG
jgi:hypothetical protein